MADSPTQTDGAKPKVKPVTAIIVVAVAALGGILYLRFRGSKAAASGTAGATGAGTVTTSYGLGPEWFLSMVKDQHSPPTKKPRRWPPIHDKKPG